MADAGEAAKTVLIVGASRGLGHAMAAEFANRGWNVIGTVRDTRAATPLRELAEGSGDRVSMEQVDINETGQYAALRERLSHRELDILFVNAGTAGDVETTIGEVSTAEFIDIMVTNALSPLRFIEAFEDLVAPRGLIGAMSSGQGSITNNTTGFREVYRASKAALNMLMRSFASRRSESAHPLILMAPGWIRTDLGGSDAPFTIEENVPKVVDVLVAKLDRPGLEYLDYSGKTVPW